MNKEKIIYVKDGLNEIEKMLLLDVTQTLINGLNHQEFVEILKIYDQCAGRIMRGQND